jgi:hypothetical protein
MEPMTVRTLIIANSINVIGAILLAVAGAFAIEGLDNFCRSGNSALLLLPLLAED